MTTASIRFERSQWGLAVAGALASGLLLWAASPAVGLSWVAWVALVPAALAPGRLALPLAFGIALELMLVPALPFGLAENQWADEPVVPVMVGGSPVLVVALVIVPLVVAALYVLRFPYLGTRSVIAGAIGWTALDVLRTNLDPGGLFGELYATQQDTPLADVAALGGPWLLTFTIVLANLSLAQRRVPVLAAAIGVAAVLAIPEPGRGTFTVAAVQPGYDTAEFDRPILRFHRERRYAESARLIVRDLRRPGAELVVWPEAAVWIPPTELELDVTGPVVVPFFLPGPAESGAVVFGADGPSRIEPKHRPMWFVGEHGDPGPARPIGDVGVMLGVDSQDAGVARELAAAGARILTSSTHDWEQLAPYHRAHERIASAAVGRPLVRADWRYGSAVIDRGALRADAGLARSRTVVIAAVTAPYDTPYVHIGDTLAWVALAGAGLLLIRRLATSG